jgi:hypothetical protein
MLKDRRALIEDEIRALNVTAREIYLDVMRMSNEGISPLVYANKVSEIDKIRERAGQLDFDLRIVNELIESGYE